MLNLTGSFSRGFCAAALAAALMAPAARADVKPKEAEKGPDAQGQGTEKGKEGEPEHPKNPLPEIIELMKEVERRLAETDTGAWTQEEQERVVKALELEGKAVESMRKLIEEIESSQQSGGGGGGKGGEKKPSSGSKGGQKSPQQERQQDQGQQPVNPNQGEQKKDQQQQGKDQKKERNEQDSKNDKASEQQLPPGGASGLDPKKGAAAAEAWGSLPPKQAREVLEAQRKEPPQQWRKQIEDYLKKIAGPQK